MTWSPGSRRRRLHLSAPTTTTPLGPDEQDQLAFNLNTDPVGYRAKADTDGRHVPLTVSCTEGSDPPETSMEAGGVWFLAPGVWGYAVSDDSFTATYSGNSRVVHHVDGEQGRVRNGPRRNRTCDPLIESGIAGEDEEPE